ncbi:MAG: hypothetical protein ABSA47_06510 [Verrucomicrobiota bacterium]
MTIHSMIWPAMKRHTAPRRPIAPILLALALCAPVLRAQDTNELPAGVETRTYTGWRDCVFLNASETPVQVVVVPAVGGRVAHFSFNGQNILFENTATQGATLAENAQDLLLGGYQCDLGPNSRSLPAHWRLLQAPQRWKSDALFSVKLLGAPDAALGVAIDKDFVLAGDTGELGLVQRMRNVSDKPVSYCLADHTLCKGGGFVFFPLNKKSRFKAGWSQWRESPGTNFYDGAFPDSPDVRVLDGVLVAQTGGNVTRFGADTDAQWIAYARGALLFVKYFLYSPGGDYSDGGNSVEVYFDRRLTELDPISPETNLAAGQSFIFPEKWALLPLDKEVTTFQEARRLVQIVPPPPFGR